MTSLQTRATKLSYSLAFRKGAHLHFAGYRGSRFIPAVLPFGRLVRLHTPAMVIQAIAVGAAVMYILLTQVIKTWFYRKFGD